MTNPYQPSGPPPLSTATPPPFPTSPPLPVASPCPKVAKILGVLNIVFGCLSVPLTFAADLSDPQVERLLGGRWSLIYWSNGLLCVVLSALLVAGGVGLIRNRWWGRTLSIVFAYLQSALSVIAVAYMYVYLVVPLQAEVSAESAPLLLIAYVTIAANIIGLIYPAVLLFCLYRKSFVSNFAQSGSGFAEYVPDAPLSPVDVAVARMEATRMRLSLIAVASIVFGVLGALSVLLRFAGEAHPLNGYVLNMDLIPRVVAFGLELVLLAAGIFLWQFKPISRKLLIWYAFGVALVILVSALMNALATASRSGSVFGGAALLALAYPCVLLWCMTDRRVKKFLDEQAEAKLLADMESAQARARARKLQRRAQAESS